MAKSPAKAADSIESQVKDSMARADLYEARARISVAQTTIAQSQLDRKKIQKELDAFVSKKK